MHGAGRPGIVAEIDLRDGFEPPEALAGASLAYVLLRWRGRPVGRLVLEDSSRLAEEEFETLAREAAARGIVAAEAEWAERGEPVTESRPGSPVDGPPPESVSVIVATRDRPGVLGECLDALRSLDPPPGEILVVDSASERPDEVRSVVQAVGARTIRLERPGLSLARNEGARHAAGSVLAFLDDDCRVDPGWLDAIRSGFREDAVEAVAGQLLPAELETVAQREFLRFSHMDLRGFEPRRFTAGSEPSPCWPVDSWRIGSGGNLAVRSDRFVSLGGFDTALGLGTPARGGEDLFLLWSLMRGGSAAVYRPDALAWHRHHRDRQALGRVMFGYGAGHSAYLRAIRRSGAPFGRVFRYRLSYRYDRFLRLGRCLAGRAPYPASLVLREFAGSLAGGILARRAERESAEIRA